MNKMSKTKILLICLMLFLSFGSFANSQGKHMLKDPIEKVGELELSAFGWGTAPFLIPVGQDKIIIISSAGGIQEYDILRGKSRVLRDDATMVLDKYKEVVQSATKLADGTILLVIYQWDRKSQLVQLFDPQQNRLTEVGSLNIPRVGFTATLLDNGSVLFVGGLPIGLDDTTKAREAIDKLELYNPAAKQFSLLPVSVRPRVHHVSVRLKDGAIALIGGVPREIVLDGFAGRILPYEGQKVVEILNPNDFSLKDGGEGPTFFVWNSVLLDNDRILVMTEKGSFGIYDPVRKTSKPIKGKPVCGPASSNTIYYVPFRIMKGLGLYPMMFKLFDDEVVVLPGMNSDMNYVVQCDFVNMFNPRNGKFSTLGKNESAYGLHSAVNHGKSTFVIGANSVYKINRGF